MDGFQVKVHSGDPFFHGQNQLTLQHLVVQVPLPFVNGGLIFNRPLNVQVQTADGAVQNHYVINVTRLAQVTLWGLGLLVSYVLWRNRP